MNTAQVDPIKPDLSKYPKFSLAEAKHCTLHEGLMKLLLYKNDFDTFYYNHTFVNL